MAIEDPAELNMLASRTNWKSPIGAMQEFQLLGLFAQNLPEVKGSRTWRNGAFKRYLEEYQAALFTYGLQYRFARATWEYSHNWEHGMVGENAPIQGGVDVAIRVRFPEDVDWAYKYVAFKEWVPEQRNSRDTFQSMINKIAKYHSPDLIAAIYVNREASISFQGLDFPHLHIHQLCVYGHKPDNSCFMITDLCGECEHYDFVVPSISKEVV